MTRIGRRAFLKAEAVEEYRRLHGDVWPALLTEISAAGIRNYSIFISGRELFSFFEVDDFDAAVTALEQSGLASEWQSKLAPLMDADDPLRPWQAIAEVFHLN